MDSVSLTNAISTYVRVQVDNGTLNPTTFTQLREDSAGYGVVGSSTGQIDRLYYAQHTLDKSATVGVNLTSLPTEPGGVGSGGSLATLTLLHIKIEPNEDSTITASGLRLGDTSGTNMAKLMFSDVSVTVNIPSSPGVFSWSGDGGVARGGNSIKLTNLDSSNTITFNLLIVGRST